MGERARPDLAGTGHDSCSAGWAHDRHAGLTFGHPSDHRGDDLVAVPGVPMDGGGAHPENGGEHAHGEGFGTAGFDQGEGGFDDAVVIDADSSTGALGLGCLVNGGPVVPPPRLAGANVTSPFDGVDTGNSPYVIVSSDTHAGLPVEAYLRVVSIKDTRLLLGLKAIGCYDLDLAGPTDVAARVGPTPEQLHQNPELQTAPDTIREARWWFDDYGM